MSISYSTVPGTWYLYQDEGHDEVEEIADSFFSLSEFPCKKLVC